MYGPFDVQRQPGILTYAVPSEAEPVYLSSGPFDYRALAGRLARLIFAQKAWTGQTKRGGFAPPLSLESEAGPDPFKKRLVRLDCNNRGRTAVRNLTVDLGRTRKGGAAHAGFTKLQGYR